MILLAHANQASNSESALSERETLKIPNKIGENEGFDFSVQNRLYAVLALHQCPI